MSVEASGIRYIVHPSRTDEFKIWNLSDIHIGSRATALEQIQRDIALIASDPYSFWIGGGDYSECIPYSDRRRFDPKNFPLDISIADLGDLGTILTGRVADLFRPIKDKCLGLLFGNHEDSLQREKDQQGLHEWLCRELNVPNLGYSAFIDLTFCRSTVKTPRVQLASPKHFGTPVRFRVFCHHGAGCASTPAGKLTRLDAFMRDFDADLYFIGHVHGQSGLRTVQIGADTQCGKIVAKERLGVISGSYLKTYASGVTTYGEKRAYRPTTLGAAAITIKPETREVRAEV